MNERKRRFARYSLSNIVRAELIDYERRASVILAGEDVELCRTLKARNDRIDAACARALADVLTPDLAQIIRRDIRDNRGGRKSAMRFAGENTYKKYKARMVREIARALDLI